MGEKPRLLALWLSLPEFPADHLVFAVDLTTAKSWKSFLISASFFVVVRRDKICPSV